jgi:hypothetical protein
MRDYIVQFETDIDTFNYLVKGAGNKNNAIKMALDLGYTSREINNIKALPIYETFDCTRPGVSEPPLPAPRIRPDELTHEHWAYLWDCKNRQRKIEAIKWVRNTTGMGLKETKAWVERELEWPTQY